MNKFKYLLAATIVGFSLASCDDDHEPDWSEQTPFDVAVVSASIENGATVPFETDKIEVVYDHPIVLNSLTEITLTNADIESVEIVDKNTLVAHFTLKKNKEYTFNIPARAVAGIGSMTFAPELNITFRTEKSELINASLLDASLTNANATAEAKAVFNMLKANYGVKQLSGAMGEVAWGTGFCDLIKQETGKFPAIVGFDYIHLASSPANWIDYGDITPVKTVWNAGSIPAVTWHWNVPTNKPGVETVWDGDPVVMPGDWSGNLQLTDDAAKAVFAKAVAGAVLTVKTKDVAAGAQGSVKNSSWAGLTSALEYFDITGDYDVTLTQAMVDEIKANGLILSGHDYTVTGVILTIPAGGDLAYDAKSDVFNAANVVVEGTWENQVATADVAKLAGYLKLLQDANIPVLFRPFHEAAGDYTWGDWFWWGNAGVDATKQLWSWLRNKLTNEYGLNNLIWVWTVQTSDEGKLADIAKMRAAYPGDDQVDIVGADLYVDALSNQTEKFEAVYNMVGGKKMVVLAECGNLLDVEEAIADGALWGYFMGWYEQADGAPAFVEWNKNGEWSTVLNNPNVLNQGDLNL